MEVSIINNTIDDVLNTEIHTELVDGQLYVQDYVKPLHNTAVLEIAMALKSHIHANKGNCKVFTDGVALFVNELLGDDRECYLPDVMVVCDTDGILEDGVHTVPSFVAEVTSESTKGNDYGRKKQIYKEIGVEEYWIVDIQKRTILKHLLSEDYVAIPFIHPEAMKVSVYPDLLIDVSSFMY